MHHNWHMIRGNRTWSTVHAHSKVPTQSIKLVDDVRRCWALEGLSKHQTANFIKQVLPRFNKLPTFYGNWRFITVFTTACQLYLSWDRLTQSKPSHPISLLFFLILSPTYIQTLKVVFFLHTCPPKPYSTALVHTCHMPHHPLLPNQSRNLKMRAEPCATTTTCPQHTTEFRLT